MTLRLGLVSDTHGLVRPQALAALVGVDAILHAGDIGKLEVLEQLAAVAPVCAVRGNVDREPWAAGIPTTEVFEAEELAIYLLHDIAELDLSPSQAGFAMVVHGHSHQPGQREQDGVTYINPGSIGPRRFRLPIAMGLLTVDGRRFRYEALTLG